MAKPFHELRERLLRAGVAPRHVRRYLAELADHLADLRAEEERAGALDAERAALARLGGIDALAGLRPRAAGGAGRRLPHRRADPVDRLADLPARGRHAFHGAAPRARDPL